MIPLRPLLAAAATLGLVSTAVPSSAASLAGYGFRAGAASSTIHGGLRDLVGSEPRIGFAGAFFARYSLGGLLSVQPEFGWSSKGDEGSFTVDATPVQFETRLDYLEIPVLLRLDIPTGWFLEPHALAGSGVGIRTGSSVVVNAALPPLTAARSPRVQQANIFENVGTFDNPRFRTFDWSAIAGGGLALGRGPLRFVIDSRYTLGLVGIVPDTDRSWGSNGSWTTTLGIEWR